MLAALLNSQILVNGLVDGLVIGLLAMSLVLVHRASGVINFAVSDIGLVGASLLALLTVHYGVPFWLSLVLALLAAAVYGATVELVVIRRLFSAPRVILVVATVGVAGLSQAVVAALPEIEDRSARFPTPLASSWEPFGAIRVTGAQVAVLIVVPSVAALLAWFLGRTAIGRAIRAASTNPDLARLSGVNPKVVSTLVWTVAGVLGTLALALSAGQGATAGSLGALGPSTLAKALVAAVVARFRSFPVAVGAAVAIAVGQALITFNLPAEVGAGDVFLLALVLAAGVAQGRRVRPGAPSLAFAPRPAPIPVALRDVWWARNLDRLAVTALLGAGVAGALVVTQPSRLGLYSVIASFAVIACSLSVLTGWAGQLSLGQMALAVIGALVAAALTRGLSLGIGVGGFEVFAVDLYGIPFAAAIPVAALVTAGLAAALGAGAIRVRGLLLAPVTFVFSLAAQQYLVRRDVFTGGTGGSVPFPRGALFGIDLRQPRTYLLFVIAVLALVLVVLGLLRRSGVGRSIVAVRDNPATAAGYTVSPPAMTLRAFALAGGLAGLGGALLAGSAQTVNIRDETWLVGTSVSLVAMVVVGGLGSNIGPVLGALWVVGLPSFFPDSDLVPLLTSSIGLLVVLLYLPGGFVQVAHTARTALLEWAARDRTAPDRAEPPRPVVTHEPPPGPGPALAATAVRVRFGGAVAVDGVDLHVAPGEVVGLIGTNGAGKTTLMDAICGAIPTEGTVTLDGQDISARSSWWRARAGIGRTHQAAALFPELTVRETVLVALEARGRTGLLATALHLPHAVRSERGRLSQADELVDLLGLGRYAEVQVRSLSTGTRRIVELAGLLALDARVLCLDEPTAGVAQRETEAFGPLLLEIRRQLDASILIVEHDMPLVTAISDRLICLEAGAVIADGPPEQVRNDPAVVASYLGTDPRAIARSGALVPAPTSKEDP